MVVHQAEGGLDEGGFSAAVRAHDAHDLPLPGLYAGSGENVLAAQPDANVPILHVHPFLLPP